jgi:hypothetical protein
MLVGRWIVVALLFACTADEPPARRLLFDFEVGEEKWQVAAGNLQAEPSQRKHAVRRHGDAFLDSAEDQADRDVELHGVLVSPTFTIDHGYLVFRAGAMGDAKQCWLELRDAGTNKRLRKIPTVATWMMETHVVDVTALEGRDVRLQLVDRSDGAPCSLHIDWMRLVDG